MLKITRKERKKLKWGIAGCGRFTENRMIPAMLQLRRSSITSLFSNDKKRAKTVAGKYGIENYYSDYEEFLKSDINTVYVASANYHHHYQVIKAAEAGKNILCEKPLALNSAEAEEMVNVCRKAGVQFAVNYPYRFHPLIIKSRQFIEEKKIGKLVSVNINFNINLPPGSTFRHDISKSGGGSLRDIGTHVLDLLRFYGGEVESITGYMDSIIYRGEVDDFSAGVVKFKKGGYGSFNVSFNNKKSFNRIEILGHEGAIALDSLLASRIHSAKITLLFNGEAKKVFIKKGNILYNLLKSVQKSFISNDTPEVTGNDGLINMKLMEELEAQCLKEKK